MQSVSHSVKKNLPNVQNKGEGGGGVKGVLDNVEKTAGLVKKDMPYGDDDDDEFTDNGDYLSQ